MEVVKVMEKELICSMCMEIFKKPKLLTCMHTFCELCIKPLIAYDTGEVTCPVCRNRTKTEGGVTSLSTNFIAQNIINAYQVLTLKTEGILKCNDCDEDVAEMFCCDCFQRLCLLCTKHHQRSSKLKGHEILQLDHVTREHMLRGQIKKCAEHEEILKYYCKSCCFTICNDCTVSKKHSGHTYELTDEIILEDKQELKSFIKYAIAKKKAMAKSIYEAEHILQNLEEVKDHSKVVIEETFDKISDLLHAKKSKLIGMIEKKYSEGFESINKVRESENILAEWISFMTSVVQSQCNADIIDEFPNLKRQLEDITAMTFMKPKSLLEIEEAKNKKVASVKPNPNAKSKPRVASVTQILGLDNQVQMKKPFDSHSSETSSAFGSQVSLTEVDASGAALNMKPEMPDTSENNRKTTEVDRSKVKKIIPAEMTPDLDVAEQIKFESLDAQSNSNDEEGALQERKQTKSLKNKPPPRPPPARVHANKTYQQKRRKTIANKPSVPPPPPPMFVRPRSSSQPKLEAPSNSDSSEEISSEIHEPAPVEKSHAVLSGKESVNSLTDLEFPGPPSTPPSDTESLQDTPLPYEINEVGKFSVEYSEGTDSAQVKLSGADSCKQDTVLQQLNDASVLPTAPPRFFAGITMVRQEVTVNYDVLDMIIEAINDSCLVASDQDSEVAQSDSMFSTKEEIFQQ